MFVSRMDRSMMESLADILLDGVALCDENAFVSIRVSRDETLMILISCPLSLTLGWKNDLLLHHGEQIGDGSLAHLEEVNILWHHWDKDSSFTFKSIEIAGNVQYRSLRVTAVMPPLHCRHIFHALVALRGKSQYMCTTDGVLKFLQALNSCQSKYFDCLSLIWIQSKATALGISSKTSICCKTARWLQHEYKTYLALVRQWSTLVVVGGEIPGQN